MLGPDLPRIHAGNASPIDRSLEPPKLDGSVLDLPWALVQAPCRDLLGREARLVRRYPLVVVVERLESDAETLTAGRMMRTRVSKLGDFRPAS